MEKTGSCLGKPNGVRPDLGSFHRARWILIQISGRIMLRAGPFSAGSVPSPPPKPRVRSVVGVISVCSWPAVPGQTLGSGMGSFLKTPNVNSVKHPPYPCPLQVSDIKFQATSGEEKESWIKALNEGINRGKNKAFDEVRCSPVDGSVSPFPPCVISERIPCPTSDNPLIMSLLQTLGHLLLLVIFIATLRVGGSVSILRMKKLRCQ